MTFEFKIKITIVFSIVLERKYELTVLNLNPKIMSKPWREKRLEMALIQISVPARENYRVIKGF
jgi:hypothetical protein